MKKVLKIWVCEECNKIFTDEEKIEDCKKKEWGHKCNAHPRSKKQYRCEAYLRSFTSSE
jgi:hypothetical protein